MTRWSDVDIPFGPEDHPEIELSNRNLLFVVKLPIGWHKVANTLINNGASLNLIMSKTFIEMGHNMKDLTPMNDTFHEVIPGQSLPSDASAWRCPMEQGTTSARSRTVVALHSSHQLPRHQLSPPLDLRQLKRVHLVPQRPTSSPPINQWTGRGRRLMTRKS
jgi:hypothetical protein